MAHDLILGKLSRNWASGSVGSSSLSEKATIVEEKANNLVARHPILTSLLMVPGVPIALILYCQYEQRRFPFHKRK
jgi:hypothetical protein